MPELVFPYRRRPIVLLFCVVLGFGCAALFASMALYDDELELGFLGNRASGFEALALAWFFAIFMAGFGMFGVWALLRSMRKLKAVTLGATALIAPKAPVSNTVVTVPYNTITGIKTEDVVGQVMINVAHENGKVSIPKSWLADKSAFDTIKNELEMRWDKSRGVNVS